MSDKNNNSDDDDDVDDNNNLADGSLKEDGQEQQQQEEQGPPYDWSAYRDDEGRIYYYNNVTDESAWDAPEYFNPPPPSDDDNDNNDGDDEGLDGPNEEQQHNTNDDDDDDDDGVDQPKKTMDGSSSLSPSRAELPSPQHDESDDGAGARNDGQDDGKIDNNDDDENQQQQQQEQQDQEQPPPQVGDWIEYQDDEGRSYYFNTVTEETTWDRPTEFDNDDNEKKGRATELSGSSGSALGGDDHIVMDDDDTYDESASPSRPRSPIFGDSPTHTSPENDDSRKDDNDESDIEDDEKTIPTSNMDIDVDQQEEQEEEPIVVIDPAVQRLEDAKIALSQLDSIMEPGIMVHLTEVVTSDMGNPSNAIQALSESTRGQTAVCGLLSRWLADLKMGKGPITTNDAIEVESKRFDRAADDIREMTQNVVNTIATERFTNKGGDSILNLSRSEATFLEDMMDSNRWRKLLIDLSASNKDSALLMYCLQAISKRGHHREIARRIKQSDHFAVFNAMLASELSVIGKIAVSSCHDKDTSISLNELTGDLRRICTSTAYTYLYSYEVLTFLVRKAKADSPSMIAAERLLYARVIRKWERLLEVLQSTMMDPSDTAASSPLFRKRRLDVACTMSELHQRQRRRILPPSDDDDNEDEDSEHGNENGGATSNDMEDESDDEDDDERRSGIESALLSFLRNYCLGTQLDDPILDKMLSIPLGGDPTNFIGNLLIQYPIAVEALLGYIYKPGNQRVRDGANRNKCARLIAKAVVAAEDRTLIEAKEIDQEVPISEFNEVNLESMLCEGSRLCEQLENMVSFIVTAEATKRKGVLSPGEQLCRLAIASAPISQGVVMWAREITKGGEFVASASYPTISPNIMSLVRIIYLHHPFTRDDVCEVAFEFLRHANSDIAYQTLNHIKEQGLRLLLFLCVRGEAPTVLDRFLKLVTDPSGSCLDASLIRYFVSGLLEVAQPPFSIPFIRSFTTLLKSRPCVDAIKTSYFDEDSKRRLDAILKYLKMRATGKLDSRALAKDDTGLMQSILSIYT